MTGESNWLNFLQAVSLHDGRSYFNLQLHTICAKGKVTISPEGKSFNTLISSISVNIEQALGNQSNLFAFLAFHHRLQAWWQ